MQRRTFLVALPPALIALPRLAHAQGYPNKPIRYIVPVAAGGGSDMVGRTVTERWGKLLEPDLRGRQPGRRRRRDRLRRPRRAPRPTATR